MSRHSKNNTANSQFTYAQRQMIKDFGTQKQRLGMDSQKQMEICNICLHRAINPMACDKGHIYCKVCIVENLMQQKQDKIKKQALLDIKKESVSEREQKNEEANQEQQIKHFEKFESVFDPSVRKQEDKAQQQQQIKEEKIRNPVNYTKDSQKEELVQISFWIPDKKQDREIQMNHQLDQAQVARTDKVSTKLMCQVGNHQLSMKTLYPVNLEYSGEEVICTACKHELKFQKMAMPKQCGHIVCRQCFDATTKQNGLCSICNKTVSSHDIIEIQQGLSSFSHHNNVQSVRYSLGYMV